MTMILYFGQKKIKMNVILESKQFVPPCCFQVILFVDVLVDFYVLLSKNFMVINQ